MQENPSRVRRWLPWILVGTGVALGVTGAFLVLPLDGKYNDLKNECGTGCPPSRWEGYETREKAGYVLLAVGGATAVAGVTWWLLARRESPKPRAWVTPTLAGVAAGGEF